MELAEAYELAVKKWQYIVDHNRYLWYDDMFDDIPILRRFRHGCSYCQMFRQLDNDCKGCPLDIYPKENDQTGCGAYDSPYYRWDKDRTRENAQAVLDLIIKTNPCQKQN